MECEWRQDVTGCLDERRLNVSLCGPTVDTHSQYLPSFCRTDIMLPCLWPEGSWDRLPLTALSCPEFHCHSSLDLNSWQANGHVAEIQASLFPPWILFICTCLGKLPPTCRCNIAPCLLMCCGEARGPIYNWWAGPEGTSEALHTARVRQGRAEWQGDTQHFLAKFFIWYPCHTPPCFESCQETEVKMKKQELGSSSCLEESIYF